MTRQLSIYVSVSNPSWDHPTIAHERGFSDATRGRPMRGRQEFHEQYQNGYRKGVAWLERESPMRFKKSGFG